MQRRHSGERKRRGATGDAPQEPYLRLAAMFLAFVLAFGAIFTLIFYPSPWLQMSLLITSALYAGAALKYSTAARAMPGFGSSLRRYLPLLAFMALGSVSLNLRLSQAMLLVLAVSTYLARTRAPVSRLTVFCWAPFVGMAFAFTLGSGAFLDTVRIVLCITAIAVWAAGAEPESRVQSLIRELVISCSAFIGIALVLRVVLGISGPQASLLLGDAQQTFFGLTRLQLPLAGGWTEPVVLALVSASLSMGMLRIGGEGFHRTSAYVIGLVVGGVALVVIGAKIGLGALFLCGVLLLLPARWTAIAASISLFVSPLFPWIYRWSLPLLQALGQTPLNPTGDEQRFLTLNNRDTIWQATLELLENEGSARQMVGWGPGGMATSGTAETIYGLVFAGGWEYTPSLSAHNLLLQLRVDFGIVGVLMLISSIVALSWALLAGPVSRSGYVRPVASATLCLAVMSATETVEYPGYFSSATVAVMCVIALATSASVGAPGRARARHPGGGATAVAHVGHAHPLGTGHTAPEREGDREPVPQASVQQV